MALVVDAWVGLKWILQEHDSHLAEALIRSEPDLLVPDFWLNEATNVLWLQVHRKLFTPDEAREGLALLRAQVEPTPTAHMRLHDLALDIGISGDANADEIPEVTQQKTDVEEPVKDFDLTDRKSVV